MLFDRSGGKLTKIMADKIAISKSNNVHSELLLKEVRKIWDEWDLQEDDGDQDDEQLKFESFYNGNMGCHVFKGGILAKNQYPQNTLGRIASICCKISFSY